MEQNDSRHTGLQIQALFAPFWKRLAELKTPRRAIPLHLNPPSSRRDAITPLLSSDLFVLPLPAVMKYLDDALTQVEQVSAFLSEFIETTIVVDPVEGDIQGDRAAVARTLEYLSVERELEDYHYQLTNLYEHIQAVYTETEKSVGLLDLPEGTPLEKIETDGVIERLDRYQTALLFDLLKEHGAIKPYSNKALAVLCHVLTGHSENTLRTQGFGRIWDVKKDVVVNRNEVHQPNGYNLLKVRSLLSEMISQIDKEMEANGFKK